MVPELAVVQGGDWSYMYFVSNISDKFVWEGDHPPSGLLGAIAELYGHNVTYYRITDPNSEAFDGQYPRTFKQARPHIEPYG